MRRRAVKALCAAGAALLLGGAVMLYVLGRPARVRTDTLLPGADKMLRAVLYHGSLAANSHNAQGWRAELDPAARTLRVFLDPDRGLDVVDPARREQYISLGCYVEALAFAFDAYGYDTEIACPGAQGEAAVIAYTRRTDAAVNRRNLEIIRRRHTDKRSYRTAPIQPEALARLLRGTDGVYGYEIGTEAFSYLQSGTVEAVIRQSADAAYRRELGQWMRLSDREAAEKQDGITAEMLGLRGAIKALYYLTTSHRSAEGDAFAAQGVDTARRQAEHCGAFFVVTGEDTASGWLDAGRRTQAFWFQCVENQVSVQPMSAPLETPSGQDEVTRRLGLEEPVQMLLRAGYAEDYGENPAVRRDLWDYIAVRPAPEMP